MNITEFMSFDLEWFTTLPGLLITGGVVVLLIALIIFIASNKKAKKDDTEYVPPVENGMNSSFDNNMDMGVAMAANDMYAMPDPNASVQNNVGFDNNIPVNDINNFNTPIDTNMNNFESNIEATPAPEVQAMTSYSSTPIANNVVDFSVNTQANNIEVSTPEVNNVEMPSVPSVAPTVDVPVVPSVEPEVTNNIDSQLPVVEEVTPTVEPTPVVEPVTQSVSEVNPVEKPVIYGGIDPANTVSTTVQEKPVIYGGADPLENTTTIPRMNNHEAYGINNNVVTGEVITEPVVEEPTPVVEPVVPAVEEVVTPVETVNPMPMTGAEMFGTTDLNADSTVSSSSDEIETLDF